MTTPHTLPSGDSILLVPIPEDAEDFDMERLENKIHIFGRLKNVHSGSFGATIQMPEGNCIILGKFNSSDKQVDFAPEQTWFESLCNPKHAGYCEDYCQGGCDEKRDYDEELTDLLSHLITSNNIESKMVLVLLIKK